MVHLRNLRFLEGGIRALVVSARVHQALVQPEAIEVVAQIVVMMNVLLGALVGVPAGPGQPAKQRSLELSDPNPVDGAVESGQDLDQITLNADSTRAHTVAESELRRGHNRP